MGVIFSVRHMNNICNDITDSITILQELWFTKHPIKSWLTPKQEKTLLGFENDSCSMTITLKKEKKIRDEGLCKQLLTPHNICQRQLASVIGNIVANFKAVPCLEKGFL